MAFLGICEKGRPFCIGGGGDAEALFKGTSEIFDVGKAGKKGGLCHGVIAAP